MNNFSQRLRAAGLAALLGVFTLAGCGGGGGSPAPTPVPAPTPTATAPAFTAEPADQSVVAPATATFTVTVSGEPTPELQWQVSMDGGSSFSPITGATLLGYTTPATVFTNGGKRFRVTASNSAGTATSRIAVLDVSALSVPSINLLGPQRVVAGTRYPYVAFTNGPTTNLAWVWGDNLLTYTDKTVNKTWHKLGTFTTMVGADVSATVVVARQTTTVVDTPVAARQANTCALKPDGSVACWGSIANSAPFAVPGLSGVLALGVGANHACALRANRTVACWGFNAWGQLGDGTVVSKTTPVDVVGLTDAVALTAGYHHTCALRATSGVVCWGNNSSGALGGSAAEYTTTPAVVTNLNDVVALSSHNFSTCALKGDSTVVCWGDNSNGQLGDGTVTATGGKATPVLVAGLTDAASISVGTGFACARRVSGIVVCWGDNAYGQLGDNSIVDRATPVAVSGLTDAIAISAGGLHACALKANRSIVCWGMNHRGQLGDGGTVAKSIPAAVPGHADVAALSAGGVHTCALKLDGSLVCWGNNEYGELGAGTTSVQPSPVPGPVLGGAVYWN